ncbi:hypothetical protein [Blastochloris viridis]|uniref:Uncharacterized protein n=1 Tax=Blastochloris viridis TaxID=1079 RepID=A0A0H5BE23_BLAVI|nr:hypothetical protein [Blastochloris viridis]ALK09675.1 hypothetical protein BVIR_1902 [Blastochloris viridis]BAS00436.1 hypothetical protein BV133_2842 [Blastochloris viridis]CUU42338.1 hypothetical protein BVIRIDIS_13470 [Blastochloris viridis]
MTDSRPVTAEPSREPLPEMTNLDEKYQSIGISAVAAAARFAGPLRNNDHAPAPERRTLTTDEILLLG